MIQMSYHVEIAAGSKVRIIACNDLSEAEEVASKVMSGEAYPHGSITEVHILHKKEGVRSFGRVVHAFQKGRERWHVLTYDGRKAK